MRIWVLNHNLREEGTWHRAWNLARQLARHGHTVTFFTVHPRRRFRAVSSILDGVQVYETPYLGPRRLASSGLDGWDIAWRLRAVLRQDWDALYAFSSLPNVALPLLMARRFRSRRMLLSDWDDLFTDGGIYEPLNRFGTRWLYRFERWLEMRAREVAHGVTVTSQYLKAKTEALRRDGRVAYLPTGANLADIAPLDKTSARRQVEAPADRILVTYIGGGFNEDALILLRAFAHAVAKNPNLYLLFIGNKEPRYLSLIAALRLDPYVRMVGRIPYARVPLYLAAADMLAMPLHDSPNSRARGPIKLRDYLCAGRPIVGTALGEVEDVLRRYAVGRLAELSPESLGDALVALAAEPAMMEALGREARRVAEQELSWDVIGDQLQTCVAAWMGERREFRSQESGAGSRESEFRI